MDESSTCAIVTGGGRGIGESIALRLAQDRPVILVGRTVADLEKVSGAIADQGGLAIACAGDIADPLTAAQAVALANDRGWAPVHLVCNAGMGKTGTTATFDPDLWRRIFDVNVHGSFHFVQACLPAMLERGSGTICIMSSLAGVQGVAFDAAYSATKHALVGLARSLALEYGKLGIGVFALCPSFIESDMTQRTIRGVMKRRGLTEADAVRRVAEKCPARRILESQEIAEAIAALVAGDVAAAVQLAEAGGYPLIPSVANP